MFKLGKKIQTLVSYSNDVIYVLFRGEGSGKGNSKDLGRGDPFNAGKQRRKGSIRKERDQTSSITYHNEKKTAKRVTHGAGYLKYSEKFMILLLAFGYA